MVYVMSNGESWESIKEANLDRLEVSSTSDDDGGLTSDDPHLISVNSGIMIVEKMNELVLRY